MNAEDFALSVAAERIERRNAIAECEARHATAHEALDDAIREVIDRGTPDMGTLEALIIDAADAWREIGAVP